MLAIPFRLSHLAQLEFGTEEQTQDARVGCDMFGALADRRGPAWSLVGDRGRIVGCFGMLVEGRCGIVWAVLSDEARANRFGLHRAARRALDQAERLCRINRTLAAVRMDFQPGHRWIRHLGFTRDGDFELGNERYERYVK